MSVGAPGESDQGFGVPADVSNAGEGTQDWSGGLSCSALGRLAGDEAVQEVTASGLGTGLTSGTLQRMKQTSESLLRPGATTGTLRRPGPTSGAPWRPRLTSGTSTEGGWGLRWL